MATGYLPSRENDVPGWVTNFTSFATLHLAALGVTIDQVDVVSAAGTDFNAALAAHDAAQVAAKSARGAKDTAKKNLFTEIRSLVKIIQAHPGVTDEQRLALGINVPKDNRTPVPVPTARPDPDVRDIDELTHTLRLVDSETNKTAKPAGVAGIEIWGKVVPPGDPAPVSPDELSFIGYTTTSKFVRDFDGPQIGHTAYYRTRYLNTRGEHGPWGNQVGATVAA